MRTAVLVFALATLLAGCLAPSGADGLLSTPPAPPAAFAAPVPLPQVSGAADPVLATAPDGTLWIAAIGGTSDAPNVATSSAWVWRSRDAGATWDVVRGPVRERPMPDGTRRPFGNHDMDLVVAPDGWVVHAGWWTPRSPLIAPEGVPGAVDSPIVTPGNYVVEASGDGGETWQSWSVPALDGLVLSDAPRLAAAGDGRVWLAYAVLRPSPDFEEFASGSDGTDPRFEIHVVAGEGHGASWGAPVVAIPLETNHNYVKGRLVVLPDGRIVIPYGDSEYQTGAAPERPPSEVRLAVSDDGGATWASKRVVEVAAGFSHLVPVQAAADASGRLVVAWGAWVENRIVVHASESVDGGESWSAPVALNGAGTGFAPDVAAGPSGEFVVAWYGSDVSGEPEDAPDDAEWHVHVARRAAEGAWTVTRTTEAPVKSGPICSKGPTCRALGQFDWLGAGVLADGRAGVAFTVDEPDEARRRVTFVAETLF